ncbi:MAG: indole-3-glycerol phosphate synthase TrpC [Prevotella sp.]|nr:indole-3-glycerol phosphate synthase TrpC [Prevotella sp.]
MRDILDEIVAHKRVEVARQKEDVPPRVLYARVEKIMESGLESHSMRKSLADSPYGIIAEFKRKSPSKGWIHADTTPMDVVPFYARNGASALSILTDEEYFGGCMDYVRQVRPQVSIPILRKDFIVDEYQLFQAKEIGADAVLLIAADLTKEECAQLNKTAHELKLEVLLEIHSPNEIDYVTPDVDMVGVNNRNLGTFHTDVQNSFNLAHLLPEEKLKVSESGISNPAIISSLREVGFRGFLIGECFMKETDPGKALSDFIKAIG